MTSATINNGERAVLRAEGFECEAGMSGGEIAYVAPNTVKVKPEQNVFFGATEYKVTAVRKSDWVPSMTVLTVVLVL